MNNHKMLAGRCALLMLSVELPVLAQVVPQPRTASAEQERAAAVRIELVRDVPWKDGPLAAPDSRRSERTNLSFSGDAAWLAVRGEAFVEVATGKAVFLERDARTTVIGPDTSGFLFLSDDGLRRGDEKGRQEPILGHLPKANDVRVSPTGAHLFFPQGASYHREVADPPFLFDLATQRRTNLKFRDLSVSAIAWSHDEKRVALALAFGQDAAEQIVVVDAHGRLLQRFAADSEAPITALAFDFDGTSVLWGGRRLHRGDVATGRLTAWGEEHRRWVMPLTPDLVLASDGYELTWLASRTLLPVRHLDLGCRGTKYGASGFAISNQRDLLAVACPGALRLFRVRP